MNNRNTWGYNIENKDIDIQFRTFKGSVYKCDNIVFKILTQNLWGVDHWADKTYRDERLKIYLKKIMDDNFDIICFQEINTNILEFIKSHLNFKNYYFSNISSPWIQTPSKVNDVLYHEPNVYSMILSKTPIFNIEHIMFGGELNFHGVKVDMGLFKLLNVHFHSGSKLSNLPNSEKYHVCRVKHMLELEKIMKDDNVLLCGDFNIDLNSNWLETEILTRNFRDIWLEKNGIGGYTEDTDINKFRYYLKNTKKKIRNDGFLVKKSSNINFNKINLYGNTPLLKKKINDTIYDIYGSDHFGVSGEFEILNENIETPYIETEQYILEK